jgi:Family of unknown function (DUF6519)
MKGDFSRETFDPKKHYAGVLMQQGRVQVDADWNEQEAIQRRRTQVEARDVIGHCGAPRDDAGFEVKLTANKLTIGEGRFYADGLLAENESHGLPYESQPDLLDPIDWQKALKEAGTNLGVVYLDVWERHITPLDDHVLREVALGGPDTATRVKTVWQLRVLALPKTDNPGQVTCDDHFDAWDDLFGDPESFLNARSQPPANVDGPCVVPPTAGYRRLENQLYRVEIHTSGINGKATFKWSRDNGTVVTAVEKISGKDVIVHHLGPDDVLGFADGQWVELTDDKLELAGTPGQLLQIDAITASQRRITLKTAPTTLATGAEGVDPARHPKLRRWDQKTGATAAGVTTSTNWIALEDGVEIQFSPTTFRSGDYWTIPARTATGELEWPPFEVPNKNPHPLGPRGIQHHYCKLAIIGFDAGKKEWAVVDDCRPIFPPLTECCDENAAAIHVVETNWSNDDLFDLATAAKDGLRVRVDGSLDPQSLTNDTFLVFLDLPLGQMAQLFHRVYLPGTVARDPADPAVAVWRPAAVTAGTGMTLGPMLAAPAMDIAAPTVAVRVHVTLRGSCIWREGLSASGDLRRLDGQALGRPGQRQSGLPRIALEFPSGIGAPASDFESWFVLGPAETPPPPVSFRISQVTFMNANDAIVGGGDLKMPLPAGTAVGLKAEEAIQSIRISFSEPVEPGSIGEGTLDRIWVEKAGFRLPGKLAADVKMEDVDAVRLVLRDPPIIQVGSYVLRAKGTNEDGAAGGIQSMSGAALDGNYDGQPGADFAMPFQAT